MRQTNVPLLILRTVRARGMGKPNKFIRFAKYRTGREPLCEMHRCRQNGCAGRYSETSPKVYKISREFEFEDVGISLF